MKIAVIGTGYVGLVTGTCFAETGNRVICCDIDEEKIEGLNLGRMPIYEPGLETLVDKNTKQGRLRFTTNIKEAVRASDVIFIAVGTPMSRTGNADLSFVKEAAETIGKHLNGYKIIVNKSTVPVGTGRLVASIVWHHAKGNVAFDVVSNPEFLREGEAVRDTMQMERAVIGTDSSRAFEIMEEIHRPFRTKIIHTSIETAEMIKYAANAFLATKLSFINDIALICERVGADVDQVSEGIGADSRIGKSFLQAGIGYGGSCFPKDTAALHYLAKINGFDFKMLEAAIETNFRQREDFVAKIEKTLGSLEGKVISVLGLSFKPNTNDVRYAPSLDVIPMLREKGAMVKAFDPAAISRAKRQLGYQCSYTDDIYEAIQNTDACAILTDWDEVKSLDLNKVKNLLNEPVIIDGRNVFDLDVMAQLGFTYVSIGRPAVTGRVEMKSSRGGNANG